jgi:thymidylate synthase
MASVIVGLTGREVYPRVIEHVLARGRARSPRDRPTFDAGFAVIELESAHNALPTGCGRNPNPNIAAAEAIQLIGGFSRPDLLTRASHNFRKYMEDDDHFHGAYGSRVGHQVACAVRKLKEDPLTRQAVVTLWDPWLDNLPDKRDYPCTVLLQFERDGDALAMNVVMRSNDVWLGLPYDMFQFTQLQLSVANALDLPTGRYRHTVLSLHIYSEHVITAEQRIAPRATPLMDLQPSGIGEPGNAFTDVMRRARRTTTDVVNERETKSEQWYRNRFASYMGPDVDDGGANDRPAVAVQS